MPQFFIDEDIRVGSEIEITGSDAKHIASSLRLKAGDWIALSDGCGRTFRAEIVSSRRSCVRVKIESEMRSMRTAKAPTLALAMAKRDRFEWALQKVVELGVEHVVPFHSARTVVVCRDQDSRISRWRKIACEAAKQSGLPTKPEIKTPVSFAGLCEFAKGHEYRVLFYEGEENCDLRSFWKARRIGRAASSLLAIGPEGGFEASEIELARSEGFSVLGLGPQILRVETAAIAAVTIWQYELGNLDLS